MRKIWPIGVPAPSSHWQRAKRMGRRGRPGIANGPEPPSVLLIPSSGDPARGSTAQLCPVIKERHVCN